MIENSIVKMDIIQKRIYTIRGVQVMIDRDLSSLYDVETRVLNQAVKRNRERFPEEFCFQLSAAEFTNWKSQIVISILTRSISKHLALDVKKFNEQYPAIEIKEFNNSHDRFIIIDKSIVYHFGASLKDLGKKWFAFSKMEIGAVEMLGKLEGI
jgi:hypothetical protein